MSDDQPTDNRPDQQAELERLREHNKQLLAELKEARSAANAATAGVEAAQRVSEEWRARYSRLAVEEPLEADLRSVASGPWEYLRDVVMRAKLLTMEADADGIARPVWRDEKGRKADLSGGLRAFLMGVHQRTGNDDLARSLSLGNSGGGARGDSGSSGTSTSKPAPAPRPQFGLR